MPDNADPCEGLRRDFIRLLEEDEWRLTAKAANDGSEILPSHRGHIGECAVIEYVLDRLHANFPMHAVKLGSGELACAMNTQLTDGRSLYIKLKIERGQVMVMSFHISKHK